MFQAASDVAKLRIVSLQAAQRDCPHGRHVGDETQMHGGLTAVEVIVEQEVMSHACVNFSLGRFAGQKSASIFRFGADMD